MKKLLLSLSAVLMAVVLASAANINRLTTPPANPRFEFSPVFNTVIPNAQDDLLSRASTSMTLAFCQDPYTAFRYKESCEYCVAIALDEELTTQFAGNKITKIMVANGYDCKGMPFHLFITTDPSNIERRQEVKFKLANYAWNTYTLDEPYEIEAGTTLLIGWIAYNDIDSYPYPIVSDYTWNENENAGLTATKDDEGNWVWNSFVNDFGAACIKCVVEGDNLPENIGSIIMGASSYSAPGSDLEFKVQVTNEASNEIKNFEVEVTVGDQEPATISVSNAGISQYKSAKIFSLTTPNNTTGLNIPVSVRLLSVNGVDQPLSAATTASDVFNSYNGGYPRNMVVEEGTGTWCGWCPRGIVGMEEMSEAYPDGTFIPIAVHSGDQMALQSYPPLVDGFPGAVINRDPKFGSVDPSFSILDNAYKEVVNGPKSFAKIELKVSQESSKVFKFESNTTFSHDADGADFALAYVITENNVGPYSQQNYYAGGTSGEMGGWEKKGSSVSTKYNDVARAIYDMEGLIGSVPVTVKADEPFSHEYVHQCAMVKTPANCRFVAMLINRQTGIIENAVMVNELSSASVDEVIDNNSTVTADNGTITLNGEGTATIYTTDGRKVATLGSNGSAALPAGLYIVNTPAGVSKLIVK